MTFCKKDQSSIQLFLKKSLLKQKSSLTFFQFDLRRRMGTFFSQRIQSRQSPLAPSKVFGSTIHLSQRLEAWASFQLEKLKGWWLPEGLRLEVHLIPNNVCAIESRHLRRSKSVCFVHLIPFVPRKVPPKRNATLEPEGFGYRLRVWAPRNPCAHDHRLLAAPDLLPNWVKRLKCDFKKHVAVDVG